MLREGFVEQGQALILVDRPYPGLELVINQYSNVRPNGYRLPSCPLLAESWRTALVAKAKGVSENIEGRVIGRNRVIRQLKST